MKEPEKPSFDLEIPSAWCTMTVDQISTRVVDGVHKKPNYVEKGVPFIKVNNLTRGKREIDFENVSYISKEDHRIFVKRANPKKGDILITKDGTLGIVKAVNTEIEFSIFVSVALIKPVDYEMSSYLEIALSAPQVQETMKATGTGLQHLHLRDLRAALLPLPSSEEQKEIVRRVDALFKLADQIEARYSKAKAHVDKLTQAILAKAFRGELAPQDPNDEPAEALLERIRKERLTS